MRVVTTQMREVWYRCDCVWDIALWVGLTLGSFPGESGLGQCLGRQTHSFLGVGGLTVSSRLTMMLPLTLSTRSSR